VSINGVAKLIEQSLKAQRCETSANSHSPGLVKRFGTTEAYVKRVDASRRLL